MVSPAGPKIGGAKPWPIKVKINEDGRQEVDHEAFLHEKRFEEVCQALLTSDPQKIEQKAAARLLRYVRTNAAVPAHYFAAVTAANRHHFFKDAMDLTVQFLRKADQDSQKSLIQAWQRRTLIEAMNGLTPLPGFWKNVLSLLQRAGHHTDLSEETWNEAHLVAAGLCQELKWKHALNLLEVISQRPSFQDMLRPPDISRAKLLCAATARRWALAFSTWRAMRCNDSAPWADREASVMIATFDDRLDRSICWSLGLELLQELARQRSGIAESFPEVQQMCSKSSQWATLLALGGREAPAAPRVLELRDVAPRLQRTLRRSSDVFGTYHLIKAACRAQEWQESLSLLAELPTRGQAEMWESQFLTKAYSQVMVACSRAFQVTKALEVFRCSSDARGSEDPILLNTLLSILLEADPRDLTGLSGICGQVLQLFERLQEVQMIPDFSTYQALLAFLEAFAAPEAAVPLLDTMEGELRFLARSNLKDGETPVEALKMRRLEIEKALKMRRLEIEKVWQILEVDRCEIRYHWSRKLLGSLSWHLPPRQDLSSFTSRLLLTEHCHLPMEAPWSLFGSRHLRTWLGEARRLELDRDDANWCCYAWMQYQIFLPAVSRPRGRGHLRPLDEPRGRLLSCRGRAIGNRKADVTVASQDRKDYGPPFAVRNALLQVIAVAQRRHFGQIYNSGKGGDYGWIWCPELGDVFFSTRLLPHDEWSWGQRVSFALDYNRRGLPKAVKLSFEDSVPPLISVAERWRSQNMRQSRASEQV